MGFQVYEKKIEPRSDLRLSLQLWDIGGQSINSKNLSKYLHSANVVFIMYDVTNRDSFSNMDDWLSIVHAHASKEVMVYIVGNKIDLFSTRQISQTQHDKFILDNGLKGGFFFSAKTGDGILKSFYQAACESVGVKLSAYELGAYSISTVSYTVVLTVC